MTDSLGRLTSALADRYRIERELGQGGMATVYLAEDLKHKRHVALKVLRPELSAVLGAERFVQEITTTAALQHPHILPLFDSGSADGFLYYVMPYVEGETLRDRLSREKQLGVEDAVRITTEVADALDYAHRHGVVHRDIKPDNIMFSSGHAVVADFGIARAIDAAGGSQLTATGMALGTPAYMSPEQSAGESNLDGRSDQYALGSVLYELLAGEPPFTGQTAAAIIAKRMGSATPRVGVLRDTVPASVDRALQKALQRVPADRFADVSQFAAALQASVPTRRPIPRRAVISVLAVLALAAVGVAWRALRSNTNAGLDANVIAVLPFRVGGSNAGIAYLRESMLDLLQARLGGATGPRTVEPRTLLAAWRRAVHSENEDLSEDASRSLARGLGAGRVLLGSAIATPTELTLSGSLLRVADGKLAASGSVAGSPDSVAVLVNRLTARLLSLGAGESRERLDGLAATSLEALKDYLAGQVAYRRGDYFGAMDLYARALGRDSSFAQAAFGLVTSNPYIGTVLRTDGFRAIPLVWSLRDRLSPRDRALFLGMPAVGPNYPGVSTYAEIIAQAEGAAAASPDSPEHWQILGMTLMQYGAAASITDITARAARALDHAIALDSGFAPALTFRLYVSLDSAADLAASGRLVSLVEQQVAAGYADAMILWAVAVARGDSAAARRWRGPAGETPHNYFIKLVKLPLHAAQYGLPLGDARWANETLRRDGATEDERRAAWLGEQAVAFAEGRVLQDVGLWGSYRSAWTAANMILQAIVEPVYRPLARQRVAALNDREWPPIRDCDAELLRVTGGDTSATRAAIARLRAFAAHRPASIPPILWGALDFRVCPLLLEALLHERDALDSLEALMRGGPRWFTAFGGPTTPVVIANWTIARLREAQGNIPAALAAIRRREESYYPAYLWTLPAFLRQEGRLAALAGDTAGARRAYDKYLVLRTDPDPPFRSQWDSVIAERTKLLASLRR